MTTDKLDKTIVFPNGDRVRIYAQYNSSGWRYTVHRVTNGVNNHDDWQVTDDDPTHIFKGMVAETESKAEAAKAVPVTGYVKVSALVHLSEFNQRQLDNLLKDIKEDLGRYIGVYPVTCIADRLGESLLDENKTEFNLA